MTPLVLLLAQARTAGLTLGREDHGYIRRGPDVPTGGRRSVVYQVNPGDR